MATMPDRKRTMTKEFMMLCKHTKDKDELRKDKGDKTITTPIRKMLCFNIDPYALKLTAFFHVLTDYTNSQ